MSGNKDKAVPVATDAVLLSMARIIADRCAAQNADFLSCKKNDANPEACLSQGRAVITCVRGLLEEVSEKCPSELEKYSKCIGKTHQYPKCRGEQSAFEKCWESK